MAEEYYIRKSDVEKLIDERLKTIMECMTYGKGLTNSIINLTAVKADLNKLYSIRVRYKDTAKRKGVE